MLTDIEIANAAKMKPIQEIAQKIGVSEDDLELYGKYKAKVHLSLLDRLKDKKDGRLILVSAISPTPAGEGKTTVTVGLGQALNRLGHNAVIALREPSLGPVMGVKGGAAGGGYSQVVPMEHINLHFTGDMHAITSTNNLLSALIDNHLHQGNALGIDQRQIVWKRVLDTNDRALRHIVVGLGGKVDGIPREDGFNITVASEVMAILCLSTSLENMTERLSKIVVAYDHSGKPVTAGDLNAHGAMSVVLKDALQPNLVQTLENTPCFIHGGPFANIAHGCNSILATQLALKTGDYVVTEAGFGADLGAEKFLDIVCPVAGLHPDAVVIVATIRALKYNAGVKREELKIENLAALEQGSANLKRHLSNISKFGVPAIVALNVFETDTEAELACLSDICKLAGVKLVPTRVFAQGGQGGEELGRELVAMIENKPSHYAPLYEAASTSIEEKLKILSTEIYGAKDVVYSHKAQKALQSITALGYENLPICVAKTQYSFSDNPALLGAPEGFTMEISDIRLSAGAGFIVILMGSIMTMPGLPKVPAANAMYLDSDGTVHGLF